MFPHFLFKEKLSIYIYIEREREKENMLKYVLLLLSALISSEASGSLRFDDAFSISYAVEGELLRLNFTWDGDHDWAALGLHNKTNEGMPNAEILMCNTKTCQVRHSTDYVKPDLSKNQYLDNVSIEKLKSGQNFASFTRSLKQPSTFSVAITNQTLGLIFARGMMDSTTGEPLIHDTTPGRWQVNFFHNGAQPSPSPAPTPGPSPTPSPTHKAGVWPDRFDAHMTIAPSQPPEAQLTTKLGSRLRYDFPMRRQLWEYWNVDDAQRRVVFAELWINTTLYELDFSNGSSPQCSETQIDLEILRPDWLVHTTYVSSHYLLRQPDSLNATKACFASTYQISDLFQDPAPIGGMTNNWLVANSTMAEPVRLEGPDNFARPTWLTVQEWSSMNPVKEHDPGTFDIPASCHNTSRLSRRALRPQGSFSMLQRLRPHFSDLSL